MPLDTWAQMESPHCRILVCLGTGRQTRDQGLYIGAYIKQQVVQLFAAERVDYSDGEPRIQRFCSSPGDHTDGEGAAVHGFVRCSPFRATRLRTSRAAGTERKRTCACYTGCDEPTP